jgi:general secretion pathway protein G
MHRRSSRLRNTLGLTLIELLLVVGLVGVLLAIAVPAFNSWRERVKVAQAVTDIAAMAAQIDAYRLDNPAFPPDLAAIGNANLKDPWGRPYRYLPLVGPASTGKARKNKSLVPLNTDYDLFSLGKDGQSAAPLTAASSRDDVLRANNGRFIGLASTY